MQEISTLVASLLAASCRLPTRYSLSSPGRLCALIEPLDKFLVREQFAYYPFIIWDYEFLVQRYFLFVFWLKMIIIIEIVIANNSIEFNIFLVLFYIFYTY